MRLGKVRHEPEYLTVKYFYDEKHWRINWMCRQLNISHAAYYKWIHRSIPQQEAENIKLAGLIKEYDGRFGHILGYPSDDWLDQPFQPHGLQQKPCPQDHEKAWYPFRHPKKEEKHK